MEGARATLEYLFGVSKLNGGSRCLSLDTTGGRLAALEQRSPDPRLSSGSSARALFLKDARPHVGRVSFAPWDSQDLTKQKEAVSLAELMVSTLAMSDAAVKLLIEKSVFTDAEFKAKLVLSGRTI